MARESRNRLLHLSLQLQRQDFIPTKAVIDVEIKKKMDGYVLQRERREDQLWLYKKKKTYPPRPNTTSDRLSSKLRIDLDVQCDTNPVIVDSMIHRKNL